MRNQSQTLQTLTRTLADNIKPGSMTLTEIDRLHAAVTKAIATEPASIDLLTLDQLAEDLDTNRRLRRLASKGHNAGQLDLYRNELVA